MVPISDLLAVVATAFGVVMGASPILQIRRMRQTRSSADLSLGYFSILLVGFGLWLSYGLSIGNPALIISNTASLTFGVLTILIALRLRPPRA